MCPQLSTMWGRSTIKEVREKHVVTFFFTYMLKASVGPPTVVFTAHNGLTALEPLPAVWMFFFSRLVFFSSVFLWNESSWIFSSSSDKKSNNDDVVWSLRGFFCLFFCFSFSHQFEWSCAEGSEDAQKGKTRRQTPGEELWYDCIADWRNAKPWWATVVASNCFPHRRPSCFHINQVWHLKRHVPDSKEAHTNHYHCYVVNSGLINWPACVVCVFEGESRLPVIQTNVQSAIDGTMSMFCLGFGNNVDYPFLDVMCRQNKGFARRIFEGSDAALQLQVH